MPTTTTWRERLDEDLRLHDFRPKTREAYSLVARLFADRLGKDPVLATEDDVRAHLLHLREEKKLAPSTINLAVCGLRFFFVESLGRNGPVFSIARANIPRRLPVVLSRPEVRALLAAVRHPVRRTALATTYEQRQLQLSLAPTTPPPPATPSPRAARPPLSCPRCGSPMRLVRHLPAMECLALVTAISPTARAPPP